MTADSARRAHAIFTHALELDGDQRDAAVREACGDDADMLKRVNRLLRAAELSTGFLEAPAMSSYVEPAPLMPDAVGNYLVVGVLGVGGMATVYEALQENPHRRVALKVLHRSISHTDTLLRFRLEAQTLARLHHPGIAQIYEAGTAQLGQPVASPFFAMELVPDALSITQFADRHNLSLRDRLQMFALVCDAVLHGHQNGIIHRDIKPANVLVGSDARPKVIDFGIARTVCAGDLAITGVTDARQLLGTLNYMSPEQCVDPASIDVRSDVYSLGVLLYELVTGALPHDLSRCSIPQAVRIIAEQQPSPAGAIRREASGDLDAIIAAAMEKDRSRRYSGAGELAADIRRSLNNQPIEARRATVLDHARKFAQRNPSLVAAIGAAVAMLLIGTGVSMRFAYTAFIARDAALQRERELEIITEFQESILRSLDVAAMGSHMRESITANLQRQVPSADANTGEAIADWNRIADTLNFTTLAVGTLNHSIIQNYAESIDSRFASQPVLRARLLQQLAGTMNTLGLHKEALPIITDALELRRIHLGDHHEDTLLSRHALGSLLMVLGRYDESLAHLNETYVLRRRLHGPDSHQALATGTSLGGLYRWMGNLSEAERIWTDTLDRLRRVSGDDDPSTLRMLNNIGVLYAVQGKYDKAEAAWVELLERKRALVGPDHPDYLGSLANLGQLLHDQGRYAEAEPLIRQALAAERQQHGDQHRVTLTSMIMLASLLMNMNRLDEAFALQLECFEGRLAVLGNEHPDTIHARSLLGVIIHARGDRDQGEQIIREAAEAQIRVLGEYHPRSVVCLAALRDIKINTGRLEEALPLSTRIATLSREGAISEPHLIGTHLSVHGDLLFKLGHAVEAEAHLHEGFDTIAGSVGPSHPLARSAAARLADYYAYSINQTSDAQLKIEHEKWLNLSDRPPP